MLFAVLCAIAGLTVSSASAATYDAYVAREKARLVTFARWLDDGGATRKGLVGEFGWPEQAGARKSSGSLYTWSSRSRWGILGKYYYKCLVALGLEATYWAGGEHWRPSYNKMAFGGNPLNYSTPQGNTITQAGGPNAVRGVNMSQPEFAASMGFPKAGSWRYLAAHNVRLVRLPFKWELLQPTRQGALAADQLGALSTSLHAAATAGIKVILDAHNYGAYEGSRMSGADLADLWKRMSVAFKADPAVVGYDLMNEPNRDDMGYSNAKVGAADWEAMSQQAVTAIRINGDTKRIYVMGFQNGPPEYFPYLHRRGPWISDPVGNTYYETHHYFDEAQDPLIDGGSSQYKYEYSTYLRRARAAGYKHFTE